ncbi:hypothetical protein A6B38_05050 [Bartonella bacilliformis]|nr:hypothetical protein AL467_05530 [Bartonella bacilliformis]KZN21562.1 hypothetical protein A6B38_05050 [Bartonella bacilliformis]
MLIYDKQEQNIQKTIANLEKYLRMNEWLLAKQSVSYQLSCTNFIHVNFNILYISVLTHANFQLYLSSQDKIFSIAGFFQNKLFQLFSR